MQWRSGAYTLLLLVLAITSGLAAEDNPVEYGEAVVAEENSSTVPNDESVNENQENALATVTPEAVTDNSDLVKSHIKGGSMGGMGGIGKPSIQVMISQSTTRRPAEYPPGHGYPQYPPYDSHQYHEHHEPHEPHHPHSPYPPPHYPQSPYPHPSSYGSPYSYYPPYGGYYPSYYNLYNAYNTPPSWWWRTRRDGLSQVKSVAPMEQNKVSVSGEGKPSQEASALKSAPFWSFLNFGFNKK